MNRRHAELDGTGQLALRVVSEEDGGGVDAERIAGVLECATIWLCVPDLSSVEDRVDMRGDAEFIELGGDGVGAIGQDRHGGPCGSKFIDQDDHLRVDGALLGQPVGCGLLIADSVADRDRPLGPSRRPGDERLDEFFSEGGSPELARLEASGSFDLGPGSDVEVANDPIEVQQDGRDGFSGVVVVRAHRCSVAHRPPSASRRQPRVTVLCVLADEHPDDADVVEAPASDAEAEPSPLRGAIEWVAVLIGAVVVALVVRTYLLQAFSIPSSSMESTLEVSDRLLVNKLSYQFGDIERGDIVVFFKPESLVSPYDDLIKRVIGLPGDVVEGQGNQVFVNGEALDEPYLDGDVVIRDFDPVQVPEDHVFVMGDNRSNSADSRVFGPIAIDQIEGEAFVRYWPLNRLGTP